MLLCSLMGEFHTFAKRVIFKASVTYLNIRNNQIWIYHLWIELYPKSIHESKIIPVNYFIIRFVTKNVFNLVRFATFDLPNLCRTVINQTDAQYIIIQDLGYFFR